MSGSELIQLRISDYDQPMHQDEDNETVPGLVGSDVNTEVGVSRSDVMLTSGQQKYSQISMEIPTVGESSFRGSRRSSRNASMREKTRSNLSGRDGSTRGGEAGRKAMRRKRIKKDVFGAAEVKESIPKVHPVWLTFVKAALETEYAKWFYEDSGFYGGKIWSLLVVSLDIWFLTFYHEHFDFRTIFASSSWGPMSAHIIFSALLGASLFYRPLFPWREVIYMCSLASHWPAVTIAILYGKHPHSFIYFYIILCYFFCAFTAQARFSRVVWFLLFVPVATLFAITFPFPYWDTHSQLEVFMWFYVLPPMILLREFELMSRGSFLTIKASRDGIQNVKDQMAVTHTLLNNLFPKTATSSLIRSAVNHETDHTNTYTAAVLIVSDIESFTHWCSLTSPAEVIEHLAAIFANYDQQSQYFQVEKVALVGDSFCGAIFSRREEVQYLDFGMSMNSNAENSMDLNKSHTNVRHKAMCSRVLSAIMFSLSVLEIKMPWVQEFGRNLRTRIGVHIGDCTGSFVGCAPLTYDLFGQTVSEAKLFEQHGTAGQVHISRRCKELVNDVVGFENPHEWKGEPPHPCLHGSLRFTGLTEKNSLLTSQMDTSQSETDSQRTPSVSSMQQEEKSELVSSALFNLIGITMSGSSGDFGQAPPGALTQQPSTSPNANADVHSLLSIEKEPSVKSVNFRAENEGKLSYITLKFADKRMEQKYSISRQRLKLESFAARFWSIFLLSLVVVQVVFVCLGSTDYTNKFLTMAIAAVAIAYAALTFQRFGMLASGQRLLSSAMFRLISLVTYNLVAILASFLTADCESTLDTVFYTSQVVSMYYLCALLATQFLLSLSFWQRNLMNVFTMILAYTVTAIRRGIYKDEVMIWEISYGLALFAVSCLSYFGEYSTRTAFAAQSALQSVLRIAKTKHFDLTANALNLMLPSFVIDTLIAEGNQMFLHRNMSRENEAGDQKKRNKGLHNAEPSAASLVNIEGEATDYEMAPKRSSSRRNSGVLLTQAQLEDYMRKRALEEPASSTNPKSPLVVTSSDTETEVKSTHSASSGANKQHMLWEYEFVCVAFINFTCGGSGAESGDDDVNTEDVDAIDQTFREIEDILDDYSTIKIKTIGTAMLVVQGVESKDSLIDDAITDLMTDEEKKERKMRRERHHTKCVLSMASAMRDVKNSVLNELWEDFSIGICAGECFGAVMGLRGLRFDIFGDTVNTASRMQTSAANHQIQITKSVADICQSHSMTIAQLPSKQLKGKGTMEVFELL